MIYHVKITTCSLKNGDFLYARTQFTILRFLGRMALAFIHAAAAKISRNISSSTAFFFRLKLVIRILNGARNTTPCFSRAGRQ